MYESFYGFREKPFSLLPDAGFLYLSSKHQMALTLLEYGLMSQAGFSVISGDIGTGKTTLIRRLLNNIDPDIKVGLISNTHQSFGDLMQWVALAFDLPHSGKDKVTLYREFVDFIIDQYAQGHRTVLIVDEAQNMSADTLEELRMLSNINADKDLVLQVILVGQRELRDTLRRPDLVQFAQRIAVDYHLEPLSRQETTEYIQHRCRIAGREQALFSEQACEVVHDFTGGVPRLINTLCDTVLVYGYAEQHERIDAGLVRDVGRDRQMGGLFQSQSPVATMPAAALPAEPPSEPDLAAGEPAQTAAQQRLRLAIATESELFRGYLAQLLSHFDIEVVTSIPLCEEGLLSLSHCQTDILLVELNTDASDLDEHLYQLLKQQKQPVLMINSLDTRKSLASSDRFAYGRTLAEKLTELVPGRQHVA